MAYDLDIYDFSEEDLRRYKCFVSGEQWSVPLWSPLFTQMWLFCCQVYVWHAQEAVSLPKSRGWVWRMKDGCFYLAADEPAEEEREKREAILRERMAPILEDPFEFWEPFKPELRQAYEPLLPFDVEKVRDDELAIHFADCWNLQRKWAEIHYYVLWALGQGGLLFQFVCRELTGIATWDPKFAKLMSGFDNALLRSNKELAKLASAALELRLEGLFDTLEPGQLLSKLEESDAGREWHREFADFLSVYGFRITRHPHGTDAPIWIEKPSLVIPYVKQAMAVGGVHAPDTVREHLAKEREEAEKEVLSMVPEEQRDWFEKLMRCAQAFSYFNEDHAFYCEFPFLALLRRAVAELGKRLTKAGAIDDPEDILNLLYHEVTLGAQEKMRYDFRPIARRRKEERERYLKTERPLILGDPTKLPDMLAGDPVIAIGVGVPIAAPEEVGATLVGAAGAPGEVEGIARVIMTAEELDQLRPGEILIAPATSTPWTPAFAAIKAVITDVGGAMAHATILAREYGIPAVIGTMEATKKIKGGQKIRVDGNMLRVYALE